MDLTSIPFLWIQLILLASIIVFSATYLTKSADVIAIKTGLGRSFVGVVMLATATSLPELGTGITSVVVISGYEGVNLAAGDVFGSNIFNLLIIGLLDIFWKNGSIFKSVTNQSIPVGLFGIFLVFISIVAILFHKNFDLFGDFYLSPISIILIMVFGFSMYYLFKNQDSSTDLKESYANSSLYGAFRNYFIAASVIVAAAFLLVYTSDSLSVKMNWEHGFVGTQFLALCTSLPELAASIAAIRIMAPQLAITNLLGSNIFNIGFVLFLDDVFYLESPIWGLFSYIHLMTACISIAMTLIVLSPITRTKLLGQFSMPAMILIFLYGITSFLVFTMA